MAGLENTVPKGVEVLYRLDTLTDLKRQFAGESRRPYREILATARLQCHPKTHVMTLAEYMHLWKNYFKEGVISCFSEEISKGRPTPQIPAIFDLPVLVDTYLTHWEMDGLNHHTLSAEVVVGGNTQKRVYIPPIGKIYEVNEFGLPSKTGGAKKECSEPFIHSWWAFSLSEIIQPSRSGMVKTNFDMTIFANGGTMGCFYEFLKAHYSLDDREGFYQILSFPDRV
ncbi:MAG: hypothetical protein AABY16_04675 [Nanoarchaeota archaeon]